jgi:RimJ/RimL family protein N-acetyltransferase
MALRRSEEITRAKTPAARKRSLRLVRSATDPCDWRAALPVLESARVLLREARACDAAALAASLGPKEVQEYLPPGPSTAEDFRRFIAWARRERKAGRYITFAVVLKETGTPFGLFQVWPVEPGFETAEWGFGIGRAYWGTGLFLEAAQLVVHFAVATLGVKRLEARAAVQNDRGNAALRKLGAVLEGILRKCFRCSSGYLDHSIWSILADDWLRRGGGQRSLTD